MIGIIGIVIYCIICGALTNYIGIKKNINNAFWWGFLLGVLGLITVAGLPVQEETVVVKVVVKTEKIKESPLPKKSNDKIFTNSTLITLTIIFVLLVVAVMVS